MSKPTRFPEIPKDPHSILLLGSLGRLSERIMEDGPEDDQLGKSAAFLHFLSTAPLLADRLYFKVHQDTREMCRSLSDHYNYYINSQGEKYKLEVLNREIGSFAPYFDDFQLVLYYIDIKAKEDKNWLPLSDLVWGFYCSLYSQRKCGDFLEEVYNSLAELKGHL